MKELFTCTASTFLLHKPFLLLLLIYVHCKLSHIRQKKPGHFTAGKNDSEFILPYFSCYLKMLKQLMLVFLMGRKNKCNLDFHPSASKRSSLMQSILPSDSYKGSVNFFFLFFFYCNFQNPVREDVEMNSPPFETLEKEMCGRYQFGKGQYLHKNDPSFSITLDMDLLLAKCLRFNTVYYRPHNSANSV